MKHVKIFVLFGIIFSFLFLCLPSDIYQHFNFGSENIGEDSTEEIIIYVVLNGKKIDKSVYNKKSGAKGDIVIIAKKDMLLLLTERKYLIKELEKCKEDGKYNRAENEIIVQGHLRKGEVVEHAIKQ